MVEHELERGAIERDRNLFRDWLTVAIAAVGGITEVDYAFIDLVVTGVELGQTCGAADDQRQHSGGSRIERPQVPHLARAGQAAHFIDHVVRGPLARFVDYDYSVHDLAT